jgi:hypothetical protein
LILQAAEGKAVKGGLLPSIGGGGGKGGSSGNSSSSSVNITLKNVPYVNQYVDSPSANYYCGLASALMVRAKNAGTAPSLSYGFIESDLKRIDENLQDSKYAGLRVDVSANRDDGIFYDNNHVSGVTVNILSTGTGAATNAIWNHIKNNRQPVVILIGSSVIQNVQTNGQAPTNRGMPILHYVVMYGTKEVNGIKRFIFYDPAAIDNIPSRDLNEHQLCELMRMPPTQITGYKWVYDYPSWDLRISDPAYILLVQGD